MAVMCCPGDESDSANVELRKGPQLKQAQKLSRGVYPFNSELYCHETVPFPMQPANQSINQSMPNVITPPHFPLQLCWIRRVWT